jgi:hypothetical protein
MSKDFPDREEWLKRRAKVEKPPRIVYVNNGRPALRLETAQRKANRLVEVLMPLAEAGDQRAQHLLSSFDEMFPAGESRG